jgi:hypothetical protein
VAYACTLETEIRRITVPSQPGQTEHKTLKRDGGVPQGVDPEFKPQHKKKKKDLTV